MGLAQKECASERRGTSDPFEHWMEQERAAEAEERALEQARRAAADRITPAGWWIFPLLALSVTVWAMLIWMVITE